MLHIDFFINQHIVASSKLILLKTFIMYIMQFIF